MTMLDSNVAALPVQENAAPRWNALTKVVFRFAFVYFLLYNLATVVSTTCQVVLQVVGLFGTPTSQDSLLARIMTWVYSPAQWLHDSTQASIVWIVQTISGTKITEFPNGSGDTVYNYHEVAVFASLALLCTIAWSIGSLLRGGTSGHERLHRFLRIYIRYTLAFTLIGYGMVKVIKLQFPAPDFRRLTETYGESSPMGILWAMMGSSWGYNVFSGLGETVGGLLLFWRRTTLAGAIVCAGVMANVVALNFCYDVPVKLYSSHLFIQCLVLMAPSMGRICRLLFSDRAIPAAPATPLFASRGLRIAWITLKSLAVAAYMTNLTISNIHAYSQYGDGSPSSALSGAYRVREYSRGAEGAPPVADADRWNDVIVEKPSMFNQGKGFLRTRTRGEVAAWYLYSLDEAGGTITLTPSARGGAKSANAQPPAATGDSTLHYTKGADDTLTLEGVLDGTPVKATLARRPSSDFLLINRGFNWINNFPFNR